MQDLIRGLQNEKPGEVFDYFFPLSLLLLQLMNRDLPLDFFNSFQFLCSEGWFADDSYVICGWNKVDFIKWWSNRLDVVITKEGTEHCDGSQWSTLPGRMPTAQGRLRESI